MKPFTFPRAILFFVLINASIAHATFVDKWHLNGFVSQSIINTTDNAFFGDTDDRASFDYREGALILNGALLSNLDFSTQVLSRSAGKGDNGHIHFDYAFLNWHVHESENFNHSFLLGRIKAPIGFYNETRDSPFTRNGIFLPQSLYLDRVRNSTMVADELMYVGEFRSGLWSFGMKYGKGKGQYDDREINDLYDIPNLITGNTKRQNRWNAQISADYDGGRVRAAYSEYSAPLDYDLTVNLDLLSFQVVLPVQESTDIKWKVASIEYNAANWSVTAEAFKADFSYHVEGINPLYLSFVQDFIDSVGTVNNRPEGAYLQTTYRPSENWEAFIRYDYTVYDHDDSTGKKLGNSEAAVFWGLKPFYLFAKDITIGGTYKPSPAWLIRAELHSVEGTWWATARDMEDRSLRRKYWNIAALSASWRF